MSSTTMVHFEGIEEPVVESSQPAEKEELQVVPEFSDSVSEQAESIRKEFIGYVERLLIEGKNRIGKGSLAEVYPLEANLGVCVKAINDSKEFGTISPNRSGRPFYNSAHLEAQFLSDVQDISGEVGIPRPFYSVEHYTTDAKGKPAKISALAMENLPAVSIDDVINGLAEMPAAYDGRTFWRKLHAFVRRMHDKNIYHRDLHGGNVMVGKEDGRPYVIDFGTATYASEHDAYERPMRGNVAIARFIEDFEGLRKIEAELNEDKEY